MTTDTFVNTGRAIRLFSIAFSIFLLPSISLGQAYGVRASYENWVIVDAASDTILGVNSSSAVFFGVTLVDSNGALVSELPVPATSNLPDARLSTVSFGQSFATTVPYPQFVRATIDDANELLYYDDAPAPKENAAFAYKAFIYGDGDIAPGLQLEVQFGEVATYWDDTDRDRAKNAADAVLGSLYYAPENIQLRRKYLDILYDTAIAEMALLRETLVTVADQALDVPAPGSFVIDGEIADLKALLLDQNGDLFRPGLSQYMALLTKTAAIDVGTFDPPHAGEPYGYYIFKESQQNSPAESPLFMDPDGNLVLPADAVDGVDVPFELFGSYKDAALIFEMQRDYANAIWKLAYRYALRNCGTPVSCQSGEPSDYEMALELVDKAVLAGYVELNTLMHTLPEIGPDGSIGTPTLSGVTDALASARSELSKLSNIRAFIEGDTNLLGFSEDFLALTQSSVPESSAVIFDTYDYLYEYLTTGLNGPLQVALTDVNAARNNTERFETGKDTILSELQAQSGVYEQRLLSIVGALPDTPEYATPFDNDGELAKLAIDIQRTLNTIDANSQEMNNLEEEIRIEIWRRGEEKSINDAISTVYIDFGNRQADLTKEIAKINAEQQAANAAAAAASSFGGPIDTTFNAGTYIGAAAQAGNGAFQYDAEIRKGEKQAEKERLAARERATVNSLNDDLLDVNSRARIKTAYLRMSTLAFASKDAQLLLAQNMLQLSALVREKEDIEARLVEYTQSLADRYFADPAHRLVKDASILAAEASFEDAR